MAAALPQGENWKEGHENDLSTIQNCLCPACGQGNAVTTMLPTKVPMFREIIIMSLYCEDCNFRNSEVSFGGEIQERGERITLRVTSPSTDFNRQIIKSDSATLHLPSLQFEIPPSTQRGVVSTLEGILKRAADNLDAGQAERLKLGDVDNFYRCRTVIERLRQLSGEDGGEDGGEFEPFELVLDDPAGNSYIESLTAPPSPDPALTHEKYYRTPMQDMALGLQPSKEAVEAGTIDDTVPSHKNVVNVAAGRHMVEVMDGKTKKNAKEQLTTTDSACQSEGADVNGSSANEGSLGSVGIGRREVMSFPTPCPHCHAPSETSMCVTDIPHFKECIIMSLLCEACGYKSNEIKGGGGIPKRGTKITLTVKSPEDFAREVLKSDTAGVAVPELDMELEEGGLDGMYTSVEGLLDKLHSRLSDANPFGHGDASSQQHLTNDPAVTPGFSPASEDHVKYASFLKRLRDMADSKTLPFTLIVSDPLSNSFIGPVPSDAVALAKQAEVDGSHDCYHNYVDDGMTIEEYERTQEQNDNLGLSDMKTENYQVDGRTMKNYYGTDQMEELPDRLRRLDYRGVDHPHEVAKAPVEGDLTVMGPGSELFAVPGMEKRGQFTGAGAGKSKTAAAGQVAPTAGADGVVVAGGVKQQGTAAVDKEGQS